MRFLSDFTLHTTAIADLFKATFTASEGVEEGTLIGALAYSLMAETPPDDLRVVTAWDGSALVGAIMFTRLTYDDPRTVYLLAPVAVATDRQGEGIGQKLITHGLQLLRNEGVNIAVTYGDPAFYRRVGFKCVTEAIIPAPYKLQFPEGWQAQSLDDKAITNLSGPADCVAGFDDPKLW